MTTNFNNRLKSIEAEAARRIPLQEAIMESVRCWARMELMIAISVIEDGKDFGDPWREEFGRLLVQVYEDQPPTPGWTRRYPPPGHGGPTDVDDGRLAPVVDVWLRVHGWPDEPLDWRMMLRGTQAFTPLETTR